MSGRYDDRPRIPATVTNEILGGHSLDLLGIHGVGHWGRVLENGLRLAERTGANPRVVTFFSVFHDARRWNDGHDPEHGRRGAELAMDVRDSLDLSREEFSQLFHACEFHADGLTEGDVTVRTCWDADRLDLWRVGVTPRAPYLCTDAAQDPEILAWSESQSLDRHMPPVAGEWLRTFDPDRFQL